MLGSCGNEPNVRVLRDYASEEIILQKIGWTH